MRPSVSVIIPTYNSVELLDEALNSVWSQTLDQREIEVIVVDDGSTDSTWDYLERTTKEHVNVRPLHQANAGRPSVGRNRGIDAATGEFIFFLDSDDWFGPEALQRLVDSARENGSDVVLGRQRGENRTVSTAAFQETILDAHLLGDGMWDVLSPCRLFRRSLIERIGARFPEDMVQGEDQVFVAACCFSAGTISVLADYDYYFVRGRVDGENLSRRMQTFENKYLTTTRMAKLIVENTQPGRVRERYFHRVIYRTLAPGLGKPFMAANEEERDQHLQLIQELVLPNMTDEDLETRPDVPRLRLAMARSGSASDLIALNKKIAAGLATRWDEGQLMLDLGPDLNPLLGRNLRVRRNDLRSEPTAIGFQLSARELTIRVSHRNRFLDGCPHPPELVMKTRHADQQRAFHVSSWNGATESTFTIDRAAFVVDSSATSAIWDPRLMLRGQDQLLDMGRVGLAEALDQEDLSHESVPKQFMLYRSQQGNLSIRLLKQSASALSNGDRVKAASTIPVKDAPPRGIVGRLRRKAAAVLARFRG